MSSCGLLSAMSTVPGGCSLTVAEDDLVVQFGSREHHWPGGQFRAFDTPAGKYVRDTAFAYRLVEERIAERWAIRDDPAMLLQLGALRLPGRRRSPGGRA